LRGVLEALRAPGPDDAPEKPIMRVFVCQTSIDRAAKLAGAKRITHHDLRHLFATCSPPIPLKTVWKSRPFRAGFDMRTAALCA
jgi:hypothetical protein